MILFGYFLLAVVVFAFFRYPKWGVLAAIFLRPTIDMFWWAKSEGYVSPLYIAGIAIPMLAIFAVQKIQYRKLYVGTDYLVLAYIAVFAALTALKLINAPQFAMNSIDSIARILSVTLFYFVGRIYFQTSRDVMLLAAAVLGSVVFPFVLTLGQGALGINLTHFSDVYAAAGPGASTNAVSGYFMHGRHDLVRISGVYEGVYELAFMGAISAMLVYALAVSTDFKLKIWHMAVFPAGIFLLYSTYSRSAWVTIVATFILFFVIRREYGKILGALGLCLVLYALVENVQYRFEDELGFVTGTTDFNRFGYSRGWLWTKVFENYNSQGLIERLIGNYGLGNAENQFLGTLIWFGYIGLATLLVFLTTLSIRLYDWMRLIRNKRLAESNIQVMMGCFAISSYWLAGQGSHFITQISTQWIIWTWVGMIATSAARIRADRKAFTSESFARHAV